MKIQKFLADTLMYINSEAYQITTNRTCWQLERHLKTIITKRENGKDLDCSIYYPLHLLDINLYLVLIVILNSELQLFNFTCKSNSNNIKSIDK